MSPREYDESDARIRPSRRTRPRSKDRPSHLDATTAFVITVDRGRTTCVTHDGIEVIAMKARELGPQSVVVGDSVQLVGDLTGAAGSLARIVQVNERSNSLSRTVDDGANFERTIVSNVDQMLIVVAAANPEPRAGLIDRFLVSAYYESITPIIGNGSLAEDLASSLPNHSDPPIVIASTQVTLTRRGILSGYDTFLSEEVF